VIEATKPQCLIFLGDSFHDREAGLRIDAEDFAALRSLVARQETVWITGNHDPELPLHIGGRIAGEVALGPLTLRHEPRALAKGEIEIAGHLHPAASIIQRGLQIRRRCFVGDRRRLILPAFGSYTGALSVRAAAFEGLFAEGETAVWLIGGRAIHRFPWKRIS
jgi:hypothetical protein